MFPEWTVIVGFFIGATFGSFLNVVIWRTPRGKSLSDPKHSICPQCKARLQAVDLIPLFSWLSTKGKCRYCHKPVPSRYFWVEVMNGLIWAGIWWQYLVAGEDVARAFTYAAASSTLVAIIFIDWELFIIPDQINAFLLFVGLLFNAYLFYTHSPVAKTWGIPSSVAGGIVGVVVLWLIAFLGRVFFGKDAMGHGDIKMARGIGAVLFPAVAGISFAIAVVLGAVIGGALIFIYRDAPEPEAKPSEMASDEPVGEAAGPGTSTRDEKAEPKEEGPESIGSLLKCGLGYLLCFDCVGLFFPKFYKAYFDEDPYAVEEYEDFTPSPTMIPFGPYLALGAIIATIFQAQILGGISSYWQWATGGPHLLQSALEQSRDLPSQKTWGERSVYSCVVR